MLFSIGNGAYAEPAETANGVFAVPVEVSSGLGWKPMPGEDYNPYSTGSVFVVGSEPAKWPAALKSVNAWADESPSLDANIQEHLFRKFARIEALTLAATDSAALKQLKAERESLPRIVRQMRDIQGENGQDWQLRNISEQIQEVNKTLARWLADTPADRVQAFLDELEAFRPMAVKKSPCATAARNGFRR